MSFAALIATVTFLAVSVVQGVDGVQVNFGIPSYRNPPTANYVDNPLSRLASDLQNELRLAPVSPVDSKREGRLDELSTSDFTAFSHPALPLYALRIKRTDGFCDRDVKSYSGYLDVGYGAKHLFFNFFESRSNPEKDDVLMWINGGPGCSSSTGLYMELGPCSVQNPLGTLTNATKSNPYSWNTNANLFFLDQPVNVGFSYAEYGETVSTTEDAAQDLVAFVSLFFETFAQFKGRAFHMSGESYGGRYLPLFASAIIDSNRGAKKENRTEINLQSIVIGNGMTNHFKMLPAYYEVLCTPASLDPVLDISTCVAIKSAMPRCRKWMQEECLDRLDAIGCSAATAFCFGLVSEPMRSTGLNPYDLSKQCEGSIEETSCYAITKEISTFLDQPEVRKTLGIEKSLGNFSSCNDDVGFAFAARLDMEHRTDFYIAQLLERNLRVLIYAGTYDLLCNWVGNLAWITELEWTGSEAFASQPLTDWKAFDKIAGQSKSTGGLTWATIYGAGHMVPYDKPVESLAMLQKWLAKEAL